VPFRFFEADLNHDMRIPPFFLEPLRHRDRE
jgi:hypothetical protein